MSSAGDMRHFSRRSRAPAPAPSQLCEDVKMETSDGEKWSELCVKKEETLDLNICSHGDDLNTKSEDISIKEEDPDHKEQLYCEICKSFFFNKCEVHGSPLFIPDTSVPMGVSDRARQTLPTGLEIQESSIPDAGLGVFNKGETVPVGAHFGPYQGELVDREEAMNSEYSWVICWNRQCEEFIDAKREIHANWLRYVNCAHNDKEQNLVAFQYRGEILYRCCRPINPGQELLVWYEEEYAKDLSPVFQHLWNKKCSINDIQRCRYTESVRLQESVEIKNELQLPSKTSNSPPTPCDPLCSDTSPNEIQKDIQHCSDSSKSFGHQNELKIHQCTHTGEKPHQCSQSGKSFKQQSDLQQHQHVHTEEKFYCCSQCGKSFNQHDCLQRHQRIHTGEKPYHSFNRQSNLKGHQRTHTRGKPYDCSQCGKSFNRHYHLQRHQRIHTGEKLYHCAHCEMSFICQGALLVHERTHTGEKPYHCSHCGKSFTQPNHVQRHQRIHTGEKPYHCSQCGKSFSQHNHLQRHQLVHTGGKPYYCSQCGKMFTYSHKLKAHKCSNS